MTNMLIKSATIWPMTGQGPFIGDLIINNNLIAEIGENLPANGRETLDATGLWALPGYIDAHCHIGIWEDGMGDEGADGNEDTNPSTPQLLAVDGINPRDPCFFEALQGGVTTVATGPGSANIIGGQFCALSTFGDSIDDMLIKSPLAMKAALGENPKAVYGAGGKTPKTRMASAAILREQLMKARQYAQKDKPDYDAAMEALQPVLNGELPLKIHVHRADDIMTAIRIMGEFGLKYTLDHCTEGHLIPREIKACGAMPVLGPIMCDRCKIELAKLSMEAPKILWENGIEFALATDHPVTPSKYLSVTAALAAREGCPEEAILQAITINAAKAIGLDKTIGSLECGKRADVVLYDGHPLEFRTRAKHIFVGGSLCTPHLPPVSAAGANM